MVLYMFVELDKQLVLLSMIGSFDKHIQGDEVLSCQKFGRGIAGHHVYRPSPALVLLRGDSP